MSRILDAVKAGVPPERLATPLSQVCIYSFMTVSRSWRMGMSMTLSDERIFAGGAHEQVRDMGHVEDRPLQEILSWTDSRQCLERSIGMATLNSVIPLDYPGYFEGNALELTAALGAGKRVAVVGHFPHLEAVRARAASMEILEKRPRPGDLPAEAASEVIPNADVVTMTGVTCLNDTIEGLLALKKPGAIVIVLGPTVPLSPVLFDFGVDVIGGLWVEDEVLVHRLLSQGATPRVLRGVRPMLMAKDPELLRGWKRIEAPRECPNRKPQ